MNNTWLDRNEYPFQSNYFKINNQKLHYIDVGEGEIILFVHGTPSWSFDFRNVIKRLSSKFRCIAIDHIGFGLSDKPAEYDYSTQNHSKTLVEFVKNLGLQNFTLVVHDFGGPIGLNMAIELAERINKVVVINSWLWSAVDSSTYKRLKPILKNPLLPFLYRYLNFSAKYLLPASFGDDKLKKTLKRQYTKPFSRPSERNGTIAFAQSLLYDQAWFETLWKNKRAIQEKPVLLIWGMKDKFITPEYLEKFQYGFPASTTLKLETCGHFPQEEKPEVVADAIQNFCL